MVSVVKMATVLEEYSTEEQRSVARFFGQKDTMQRIFIKKCVMFTVGSFCRVKRFTIGSKNSLNDFLKVTDGAQLGAEVAEKTVKRLLCSWFQRTGKAMEQVYQCWCRICREINVFFPDLNITCL
jgi:hypothetical protein